MRTILAAMAALFLCVATPCFSGQAPAQDLSPTPPTFYRDVLPILQDHCQACHREGEMAPMPLVTYERARPFAHAIANAASQRKMPPWFADPGIGHFSNDPSLTAQEIATLVSWAASNAPPGNPHDAPPNREWERGWMIPQPDVVVQMPKPVAIPAHGIVEYTYEIVRTGFTEGKWVQFSEGRPSSRENVHHAVMYVRPPDSHWLPHAPIGVPFPGADMSDEHDRKDTQS